MVIELGSDSFKKVVDGSAKPVLVLFHKPGCSSCVTARDAVKGASSRYPYDIAAYSVNTVTEGASSVGYWSMGVPLVVLFADGLEVWRWRGGSVTADKICTEVKEILPPR